jgi:hypothetical protein
MYSLKYEMRIILLESVTFGETGINNKTLGPLPE